MNEKSTHHGCMRQYFGHYSAITVPSGDDDFTSDKVLAVLNWVYAWELSEDFSLAGSTQFDGSVDDVASDYLEWAQSVAVGVSLTD